jgi:hypothetical protein
MRGASWNSASARFSRPRLHHGRPRWFAKITMRVAGAVGCRVFLIVLLRRCGGALESDENNLEDALLFMPKASALKFHLSNGSRLSRALLVLRHRRALADCFGANPVASALGNPARRDPSKAVRTYHKSFQEALKIGSFYFGGIRNFLLWSDTEGAGARARKISECYSPSSRCIGSHPPSRIA